MNKEERFALALCELMKEFEREMKLVREGKLVLTSFDENSTEQEIRESLGLSEKDFDTGGVVPEKVLLRIESPEQSYTMTLGDCIDDFKNKFDESALGSFIKNDIEINLAKRK